MSDRLSHRREPIAKRRARVAELTRQGMSLPGIAALLNVTERTVVRDRVATGCAQPPSRKMTDAELAAAAQLLADGCSFAETARSIGRSLDAIRNHFPGQGWSGEERAQYLSAVAAYARRSA